MDSNLIISYIESYPSSNSSDIKNIKEKKFY